MRKRLTYRDGEGRPQWTLELLEDESGMPTTITLVGPNGRCYTYKR